MENLTGKQFGPYQIVAPLGEGGMAAVYKAYQPAMERYVALKILPRHFAEDSQFMARFQREAKLLAQLQHPHILPVFDYGQAEGYTYIVMPYVPSGTLTDLLKGQPLPLPRIRQIISQIGDALNYAHSRGLVHRDVKPSNVLMDESGNCLLTDFGLARMVEASVNLTSSGTIMGTPAYMSPEQGSGQKIDSRSDIYSLGVILYELATGRVPYKAETPIAVVYKHIHDPLPPARTVNPSLPEAVELVILKALTKNPEHRYQTAGDMVRAIQKAIMETPQASDETKISSLEETLVQPPTVEYPYAEAQTIPLSRKPILKAIPKWAYIVSVLVLIGLLVIVGISRNTNNPAVISAVTQTSVVKLVSPSETLIQPAKGVNATEIIQPTIQRLTSTTEVSGSVADINSSDILYQENFEGGKANGWINILDGQWTTWQENGNWVFGVQDQPADIIQNVFLDESASWQNYSLETEVLFESGKLEQILPIRLYFDGIIEMR